MTRSRRPKRDLAAWTNALNEAWVDAQAPRPHCDNNPGPYADYGYPLPSKRQAEALCGPCPLIDLCLANARHRKPAWGIWGGVVFIQGRQAHLMEPDDPRLQDPEKN